LACYARGDRPARSVEAAKSNYSKADFWDSRFRDAEGLFDWYATYNELGDLFDEFCPSAKTNEVLVVGSGNSAFSGELCQAGYRKITNIDVSPAAIEKMADAFKELGMNWLVMDATAMSFDDCHFSVAIDKGTLDAMMSSTTGADVASAMIAEVWRVLLPGGVFVLVSHHGQRMPLIRAAAGEGAWQCLELRRNRLSPQATLINLLRSKLNGQTMAQAFKDPELLREATLEAKAALKKMAFIDAFRQFRNRKVDASSRDPEKEAEALREKEREQAGDEPKDPRLQPYCWVYVLKKVC